MAGSDPEKPPAPPEPGRDSPSAGAQPSRVPPSDQEGPGGEEQFFLISEKIVGTAMMFIGFLNVLLSISGGYEINIVPLIIYCAGLGIWAHAVILNPTFRYSVIGAAIVLGLAFFHYGEVLFWHKQLIFWGTVVLVVFFMFKTSPK